MENKKVIIETIESKYQRDKIKPNIVKLICGYETNPFTINLKGYIMFEGSWVDKFDKVLYDINGNEFLVLDHQTFEDDIPILPPIHPQIKCKQTYTKVYSCVKLNKEVNVGDVFYTHIKKK